MKTVDFYFDFASPNSYFANHLGKQMQKTHDFQFQLIPVLLGGVFKLTNNQAPMMAFNNIKGRLEYMQKETERFIKKYKVDKYQLNPYFPVMSLMLMRGAIVAQNEGFLNEYHEKMSKCMWEQGLKLDDVDILSKALTDQGFDADSIMSQISETSIKDQLTNQTSEAVDRGVFGIPSFFVDDEMFFGKDGLREAADYL